MTYQGARNKCYSRYYFFVLIMVVFMYQLFTTEWFFIAFFGSLWLPQILWYRQQASVA
jgi:hypothetical protein